ncbi:PIN domain-containing protein [archaeon]|nr:PIN domain-containing protein [archaeon]
MGLMNTLFWDTYAFVRAIEGGHDYNKFIKGYSIITTRLNLMELHYTLLRTHNKRIADTYYERLKKYAVKFEDEIIKKSNIFKLINKKKKLSYVDCVGYILAKEQGIKFLTGDEGFKDLDNVEFVK